MADAQAALGQAEEARRAAEAAKAEADAKRKEITARAVEGNRKHKVRPPLPAWCWPWGRTI